MMPDINCMMDRDSGSVSGPEHKLSVVLYKKLKVASERITSKPGGGGWILDDAEGRNCGKNQENREQI
jgi:hypothetical protein